MSQADSPDHDANPPDGFEPFPFAQGFATLVGPIFQRLGEVDGRTNLALGFRVAPHHCNPAGICHGGMLMTVMDIAIGVNTAIAAQTQTFTPSVNLTYDFLRPGMIGEWLETRIDFAHTTKRTGFAAGLLIGPNGPVLRANGICKIPSAEDPRFGGKRDWSGKGGDKGGAG